MIPIQDVIPTRLVPVATYALLVVNIIGYLTPLGTGRADLPLGPSGGLTLPGFIEAARSTFLHSTLLPFAVDLISLWLFGGTVEDQLGRLRFVALYVVCGTTAVLAAQTLHPAWPAASLGGSLAIAAVMGAYLVLFPNGKVLMLIPVPMAVHELPVVVLFTIWCAAQFLALALMLAPAGAPDAAAGAALVAYVLAFAMGTALCLMLRRKERARVEWWDPRD